MRISNVLLLGPLVFLCGTAAISKHPSGASAVCSADQPSNPQSSAEYSGQNVSFGLAQVRTPDTPITVPGTWAQPARKHPVDPAQLKSEALELAKLAENVPGQIDQVSKGQLPKELNDNLKKIEKLSRRLRSEVSP